MSELLPLLVALPIVAAALTLVVGLRFDRAGWGIAVLACLVETGIATALAVRVFSAGRRTHELGGFPPPAGIELVGDGLSAPVAVLVAVVSLSVLAYTREAGPRGTAFHAGYLLLVAGLAGVSITGDVFNMYVFLEIAGLAGYALIASDRSGRAALASLKYLMLGTLGASLFLLGVGYAYIATGTLNMADLSVRLAEVGYGSRLVLASFGLIVTGLAVKVALFPLHTWQPDAYQHAPDGVSALVSALVSTVGVYALARVVFSVYTVEFFAAVPLARDAVAAAAATSIVAGSVLAVTQSEIKRMLAYSSVSQFGMIAAAVVLVDGTALLGAIIHLLGHAVVKGGLFAAAGLIAARTGARTVEEYAGLAGRAPVAAAGFAVLALTLVGVPPAVGFVGKWYIAVGAVEAGAWGLAAVILASTLLTLAYVARVVERMYFARRPEPAEGPDPGTEAVGDGGVPVESVSTGMVAVVVLAAVVGVALGPAAPAVETLLEPTLTTLLNP